MNKKTHNRILSAIRSEHWFITEEWLDRITLIAQQENSLTPEMIGAFETKAKARGSMVKMYDDTAVISVEGPVFRYANMFTEMSGATSTEAFSTALAALENDEVVKRVVVKYDTPGGAASGAAETSTQIRNFTKPLVTFATGSCCSLGYYWGAQGSEVIVAEDAVIGNIGVRTSAPGERSDRDMTSKSAANKILSRNAVQDILNSLEAVFIQHVAAGRGVSEEHVRLNYGQGGVFVGAAAVEAGLADRVATLDLVLGGDFPSRKSTRKTRVVLSSNTKGEIMDKEEKDGGITLADHNKAVAEARSAGVTEGEANKAAEVSAAREEATTAERTRATTIVEAGAGKPYGFMAKLVKNGATAAEATDYLADMKEDSSLSSRMKGTNPKVGVDEPDNTPENSDEEVEAANSSAYLNGAKQAVAAASKSNAGGS